MHRLDFFTPFPSALLIITLCTFTAASADAQVRDVEPFEFKITVHGGLPFASEGPLCFANTDSDLSVLSLGVQIPVYGRLDVRASAAYYAAGWKPWPDLDFLNIEGVATGSALTFSLEAVISFPVAPRVYVEPLAGFGVSRISERERDEEIGRANIIAESAVPQLTYGAGVGFSLTDRVDLHVQARGVTLVVGNQDFIGVDIEGSSAARITEDVGSLTSFQVDAGFAIRI